MKTTNEKKTAILYSSAACPRCAHARAALESFGYALEVRSVDDLTAGKIRDVEAMSQLAMTGGELPVIVVGGEAVTATSELAKQIKEFKE